MRLCRKGSGDPDPSADRCVRGIDDPGGCLATFDEEPDSTFTGDAGRALLALADDLAPHLPDDLGPTLRATRRRLGPQIVVIRPVRDALLYDRNEFTVVAGRPVELLFDNVDIMPHNLLVAAPGALAKVGLAGEAMAASTNDQTARPAPASGGIW